MSGYNFWQQIDLLNANVYGTAKALADAAGWSYSKMKQQRADSRIPKAEDVLALAKVLHTTVEYLLTSESSSSIPATPEGVEDIVEALGRVTLEERNMIRRLLGLGERGNSSSSRQEA